MPARRAALAQLLNGHVLRAARADEPPFPEHLAHAPRVAPPGPSPLATGIGRFRPAKLATDCANDPARMVGAAVRTPRRLGTNAPTTFDARFQMSSGHEASGLDPTKSLRKRTSPKCGGR